MPMFKSGDKIKRITPCKVSKIEIGKIYTVVAYDPTFTNHVVLEGFHDADDHYWDNNFELVNPDPIYALDSETKFKDLSIEDKKKLVCAAVDPDYIIEYYFMGWSTCGSGIDEDGTLHGFKGNVVYRSVHIKSRNREILTNKLHQAELSVEKLKEELSCLK